MTRLILFDFKVNKQSTALFCKFYFLADFSFLRLNRKAGVCLHLLMYVHCFPFYFNLHYNLRSMFVIFFFFSTIKISEVAILLLILCISSKGCSRKEIMEVFDGTFILPPPPMRFNYCLGPPPIRSNYPSTPPPT